MDRMEDRGVTADAAEQWSAIDGFPSYEVSDLGRVRNSRGHILSQHLSSAGYPQVGLTRDGKKLTKSVHRLVCRAFHGPPPLGCETAHLDGDRGNARAENLIWATSAENNQHKRLHGTHQAGARHPRARLSVQQVADIRERAAGGERHKSIAEAHGTHRKYVGKIIRGERWKEAV